MNNCCVCNDAAGRDSGGWCEFCPDRPKSYLTVTWSYSDHSAAELHKRLLGELGTKNPSLGGVLESVSIERP